MTGTTPPAFDGEGLKIATVALDEEDYIRAGLRPCARRSLHEFSSFNRTEVVNRIFALRSLIIFTLDDIPFDFSMSREEAYLWLLSCKFDDPKRKIPVEEQRNELIEAHIPDTINHDMANACMAAQALPCTSYVLFRSLSPTDYALSLFSWLMKAPVTRLSRILEYTVNNVLPYASDEDINEMRQVAAVQEIYESDVTAALMKLLVIFGERERPTKWVSSLSPGRAPSWYWAVDVADVMLELADVPFALAEAKRHRTTMRTAKEARAWLALTQEQGLSIVANSVWAQKSKPDKEAMAKVVALVLTPLVAQYMLLMQTDGIALSVCKRWFGNNPELTVAGLLPVLRSDDPARVERACTVLRSLIIHGEEHVVRAHIETLPPETLERISPLIFPAADAIVPSQVDRNVETPEILNVKHSADSCEKPDDVLQTELPPILVKTDSGTAGLAAAQYYTFLHALARSKPDVSKPYVAAVKAVATAESLDEFAWGLYENWVAEGSPSNRMWKFKAMGHVGGDKCAANIAALMWTWPYEGLHGRAAAGIKCLEFMGTDTALFHVNDIAQIISFKAVKRNALSSLDAIAMRRGMNREELADRIIPNCGLDDEGSRVLDFGPRQFKLSLNSELKPILSEIVEGRYLPKSLTDLPKPSQKDDLEKSTAAIIQWKQLKKQVSSAAKVQSARLENAMIASRRWTVDEFKRRLVHHPLMINLVRTLVWGVYSEDGLLVRSFRVTEDRTFADSDDRVVTLDPADKVGIVHPLVLPPDEKVSWAEILSDYELIPPFLQLGRPVYSLSDEESHLDAILRFDRITLPASALIFPLDKRGWSRDMLPDGGWFAQHVRQFSAAGVKAVLSYEPGVQAGTPQQAAAQTITQLFFAAEVSVQIGAFSSNKINIPIEKISPIVISEVLADLTSIVAKVK